MNINNDPNFDREVFMDDYSRGMDMLHLSSRAFAIMAAGIGYPNPNPNIPTACVMVNLDRKRIQFEINPHFIRELKDSDIAAVIAHETYHVLLNHLDEITLINEYPKQEWLIQAQECIINDGLPSNVGFATMDGTLKGEELFEQDFSMFSTREGYDFIAKFHEEKEEEQKKSKDSESGDSEGDDSSADSSSGAGATAPKSEDESKSGDAEPNEDDAACSGPSVEGEGAEAMTPEELSAAVKEILGQAVSQAVEELNDSGVEATSEIEEILDDLADAGVTVDKTPNYGDPNADKNAFSSLNHLSGMNLNWVELLAAINPRVKQSGRPKVRDSWHAPRRRMLHSYPDVILPTQKRLDDNNRKKGDSTPVFVLALDMSSSIPTRLLGDLAALAQSTPEHLIRAFPITWSDNYRVFDKDNPHKIVYQGGTRISTVYDYVEKVKAEEGVDPYVLVITDGGFHIPTNLNRQSMKDKWSWMAIEDRDVATIKRVTEGYTKSQAEIFKLNDFV